MGDNRSDAPVEIERLVVGRLQTNCYIVDGGAGSVVVVDPGADAARIAGSLRGRRIELVLVTHCHFDHVGALAQIASLSERGWVAGAEDAVAVGDAAATGARDFGVEVSPAPPPSRLLRDGDTVCAAGLTFSAMACPGHTPGGMTYVERGLGWAFTGDTLFAGSAGRCDLPGGDMRALAESLSSLACLPPLTAVYPGHGPSSTIGAERVGNPYLAHVLSAGR